MRKRTVIALTTLALMVALVSGAAAQTPAAALTVDEIVTKHLATKGGAEKWKTIQSQTMTGVALAQGFELSMTAYAKRPNLSRQELTIELPGQPAVQIVNLFDGTKAWMINPMTGSDAPQEMPGTESATAKAQSDFDGALIDYKAKGFMVELLPSATVAGKQTHHLKVTRKDLPTQHVYLDPDTFVELRITTEGANASETDLSDYKAIDGIMVPHAVKISQGGAVQAELKILTVKFNTAIDDAMFKVK